MSDDRATDVDPPIDPDETSVHEAMGRLPGAADVFRRFGLDTCCGGELPLSTAAEHHGVELGLLMDELRAAAGREESIG